MTEAATSSNDAPSKVGAWSKLSAWIRAARPLAHGNIAPPILLGVALACSTTGVLDRTGLVLALIFGVLDHLVIVFGNELADEAGDRLAEGATLVSGGSRVLVDGILTRRSLRMALTGAIVALLLFSAFASIVAPLLFALALAAIALLWLYSGSPLRLSYRGGGELLEMFGVGLLLPALSSYLQSGQLLPPSAPLLIGWTALALASAIASGLSDEESDRAGGKRTVVTMLGNAQARRWVNGAALLGPLMWLGAAWLVHSGPPRMIGLFAAAVALDEWWTLRKRSQAATTNAFTAQTQYKAALHALIWRSGMAWAVGLALAPLLGL